jgi:mRNA interferase MazF
VRRGDIYRLRVPKGLGHEQHGPRFGVVVQADTLLPRSVVVVAPTSQSARPATFRPEVDVAGATTRVPVEQLGASIPAGSEILSDISRRKKLGVWTKH